jgi:hypothetical protein
MSNPAEFFDRRVLSREMRYGCEEIKLECGHEIIIINPSEIKEPTHTCAECVNEYVDARKAKQKEKRGGCDGS